jgi:carbamoyl-phosphate synthase small subunit
MTYPLVGNYGVNPEDVESDRIQVAAFIIKEYQPFYSNYRATGIPGRLSAVPGRDGRRRPGHPGPDPPHPQGRRHARGSLDVDLDPNRRCPRPGLPGMEGQDLARIVTTNALSLGGGTTGCRGIDDGRLDQQGLWRGDGNRHRVWPWISASNTTSCAAWIGRGLR